MTFTNHPGFALAAVADATGPFCTQDFLSVVSRYDKGEPIAASTDDAFIALRRVEDVIVFAGDSEVTDYHTPRGDGSESLVTALAEDTDAARFILDSLPEEAAKPLTAGLTNAGWRVQSRVHEVAAVLVLPDTVDEYLSAIGKKQRHEVRRKRRRYEETVGKIRHETHRGQGWAFDEFLRLQRLAEDTTAARFILDSLPEEAAKPLIAGLTNAGWRVQSRVHEVAAVLALPDTVDEYMSAIGKKQRHEVRRKRRRYEETVGKIRHETHQGQGWAFDEFLRLQRLAEGDKGEFMTPEREAMFTELAGLEGWRLDLLRTAEQTAAVVVFGYSDATGYYLYNSGYEPDLAEASPGVVLLGTLIERAIDEGRARFDFLKGDEAYKFRLGAERRPLTEIDATRAGST